MIIKPNKFLTISFLPGWQKAGMKRSPAGWQGEARWKAAVPAHLSGLHLPLYLHVGAVPLMSGNMMEAELLP